MFLPWLCVILDTESGSSLLGQMALHRSWIFSFWCGTDNYIVNNIVHVFTSANINYFSMKSFRTAYLPSSPSLSSTPPLFAIRSIVH